ncbi:hypothetical protein LJC25_04350 [Bacteroidales bacterium OttesenSCG-928-K03]|nr:hypothetical protein [Bacteroidales bacterium OttesenSCG-928-L14]MDL2242941.1 hypothetical protein [Bacteroidales bacterium OttesenSCG-928-K03]
MEDINLILQSIAEKTKRLINENRELKNSINEINESKNIIINQLENKINILNNQLSEEIRKHSATKETAKELLNEIDECLKIYSNE